MNRQRYRQAILTAGLALSAVSAGVDNALAARSPPSLGATNDSIETFTYGPCAVAHLSIRRWTARQRPMPVAITDGGHTIANSVIIFSRTAAERNGALGNPMPGVHRMPPTSRKPDSGDSCWRQALRR